MQRSVQATTAPKIRLALNKRIAEHLESSVLTRPGPVLMSYVTSGHEIENEAGVCTIGKSVLIFCRLHRNLHSPASLLLSVTLMTSPRELILLWNGPLLL